MKVYFGALFKEHAHLLNMAGARYCLYSFDAINRKGSKLIEIVDNHPFEKMIIDSGVFTMMYGGDKDKVISEKDIEEFSDKYFKFIQERKRDNFIYVEMDVQKITGPKQAWELRRRMRKIFPDKEIINVYHLEDENPDELINFSNYIAMGFGELRRHLSVKDQNKLISYIIRKAKRGNKKIHLLGATGLFQLKNYSHCDSCDSTSWNGLVRYGKSNQIYPSRQLRLSEIYEDEELMANLKKKYNLTKDSEVATVLAAQINLSFYKKLAGDQS